MSRWPREDVVELACILGGLVVYCALVGWLLWLWEVPR